MWVLEWLPARGSHDFRAPHDRTLLADAAESDAGMSKRWSVV
jgi:hypothetical protein